MNVYDFAMKMELQGKAYYETLAGSTRLPLLKPVFLGLAADEQKHYDVLRGLKEGKAWGVAESSVLERTRSVFSELLTGGGDVAGALQETLDAYRFALKVEADSVKLYEEMARKEEDPAVEQLLLTIANEEKKHFNILDNICDFLTRPKYYLQWHEFREDELP